MIAAVHNVENQVGTEADRPRARCILRSGAIANRFSVLSELSVLEIPFREVTRCSSRLPAANSRLATRSNRSARRKLRATANAAPTRLCPGGVGCRTVSSIRLPAFSAAEPREDRQEVVL